VWQSRPCHDHAPMRPKHFGQHSLPSCCFTKSATCIHDIGSIYNVSHRYSTIASRQKTKKQKMKMKIRRHVGFAFDGSGAGGSRLFRFLLLLLRVGGVGGGGSGRRGGGGRGRRARMRHNVAPGEQSSRAAPALVHVRHYRYESTPRPPRPLPIVTLVRQPAYDSSPRYRRRDPLPTAACPNLYVNYMYIYIHAYSQLII
jgi:hypothetical protein